MTCVTPARLALFVLLLAIASRAGAQTAHLSGRVTDSTAAVVAGAAITIIGVDTGASRRLLSNEHGHFDAPFLPPGLYRLAAEHPGFKQVRLDGITLAVDQTLRVDIVLEPGALHEEVRVAAEPAGIDAERSTISQRIDNETIMSLPLNGRNYTALATLTAGAVPSLKRADGFHVNGSLMFQNIFMIDGLDNNADLFGAPTVTHAIRPSLDAIQEFTVATANYGAQYGRGVGGIVNLAIKSGTNAFHGSAFEFLRHDAFEATDFFAKRAGLTPPPLRYHQFGGSAGGPLARNRAFFFASYQRTRERRTSPQTATVPLPGMIQGRFGSVPIYDPLQMVNGVRQPFIDNVIPADRIDPVGQRLAALYPAPNQPGSNNNYVANVNRTDNGDQIDARLDAYLTRRSSLFGRFSLANGQAVQDSLFGEPGHGDPVGSISPRRATAISLGETRLLGGGITNEFRAGYVTNMAGRRPPAARPLFDEFGLRGIPPRDELTGLPRITVIGFASLGDRGPERPRGRALHVANHLSWPVGRHLLKLGGESRVKTNIAQQSQATRGMFTFSGQFTAQDPRRGAGSALADLLLGQTGNALLTTPLEGTFEDRYFGVYIDDTWRPAGRLTVHVGLRYELLTPIWERDNRMSNVDLNPGSPTFGAFVAAADGSIRARSFVDLDNNNVAPRLGATYRIGPKSVLRGAFGTFYAGHGYLGAVYTGAANYPHFSRAQFRSPTDSAVSRLTLSDGFPAGALGTIGIPAAGAVSWPADAPQGRVHEWSVDLERAVATATAISITYVGSGSARLRAYTNANAATPGPGSFATRRPLPFFEDITAVKAVADASYHALQLKVDRRFRNGFGLLVSHTWSHAIDNASDHGDIEGEVPSIWPQNPDDLDAERASSSFDVRHRLVGNFVYDVPSSGVGTTTGGLRFVRHLVNQWRIAGIFVAQSGFPMTPGLSTNPANTTTPARPDCLRDGNLPRDQRTADSWFDASAFAPAAPYTYGNCARHVLRGPGFMNLDLLVARSFELGRGTRLEVRAEIFNATNAIHLGRPNLLIDLPDQVGRITATHTPARQMQLGVRFVF